MRILFTDTETGGTKPHKDALLEVALVVYEDGEELASKVLKIKSEGKPCSEEALNINHINLDEHDQFAAPREVAAGEIVDFIKEWFPDGKATLAGHNVSFDRDFIQTLMLETGHHEWWGLVSHRLLDTMTILNFLVAFGKLPDEVLSSDGAFKYFGIEIANRHSAMGDVEGTVTLFNTLSKFLR